MNKQYPHIEVRIHTVDGAARAFVQHDPDSIERTLAAVNPLMIFNQDRLGILDDGVEIALVPPLITRIDLVTDRLSVWDFPFTLGALVELTDGEFMEGVQSLQALDARSTSNELPVYLDLEMVNGERIFLWMQVVAGLSNGRLGKIYSLLKERRLIFGLRVGGVGILNLSNLVRFSVHPEPAPETALDGVETAAIRPRLRIRAPGNEPTQLLETPISMNSDQNQTGGAARLGSKQL